MRSFVLTYEPLFEIICIYCGLAFSQYLPLRAGVYSLATPGFVSIGAYAGAYGVLRLGLGAVAGAALATLLAGLVGLILAIPLARLRGHFQTIATIAFMEIMVSLEFYAEPLTGGALGMNGIPKLVGAWQLVIFVVVLTGFLAVLKRTGIGRAFDAIRQDPTVARSLGIAIGRYHCLALALSGAVGGLSGSLLAYDTYSLMPDQFGFGMLVTALAAVILGGRSSVAGPIVGTIVLLLLPEVFRPFAEHRLLLQGALLILIIIYLPQGIVDTLSRRLGMRFAARRPALSLSDPRGHGAPAP
jgi:branched-chain amino acid transport system permease protein